MPASIITRGQMQKAKIFLTICFAAAVVIVGIELVARATPDGYTLLFFSSPTFVVNPSLRKVGYDPVGDFIPVAQVASAANLLVVPPSLPARSVKQLITLARAK